MGKPLKSKNFKGTHKAAVLARQGVKINKRTRLGHTGHFGKVTEIPIAKKPTSGSEVAKRKSNKSRFNKFKNPEQGDAAAAGRGAEQDQHQAVVEEGQAAGKKKEGDARTERLPGESFCKFMKRLNNETRERLITEASKARKVSTKRKEHLAKRKEKKKEKKDLKDIARVRHGEDDDVAPEKNTMSHKLAQAQRTFVKFGEQADRPPLIRMDKPLKGLQKAVTQDSKGYVVGGMPCIPEMSGSSQSKREYEELRKNAISQYRNIMAKKREGQGYGTVGALPGKTALYAKRQQYFSKNNHDDFDDEF